MTAHSLELTLAGIVSALPVNQLLPQTKPEFLRDILALKRERGDTDCAEFREVCDEFASGLNATVRGAEWAMRQWVAKRPDRISDRQQAAREAFLRDLRDLADAQFVTGTNGQPYYRDGR